MPALWSNQLKQYIATINGKTVRATATGIHRPGEGYRFTEPLIQFYPEGGRGHTLALDSVQATNEAEAASVAGDVLTSMGFEQTA